eukprot:SAG11_NODE_11830_length_736_cov_1.219780_1_plen_123_part_10
MLLCRCVQRPGDENVVSKLCEFPVCRTRPTFGSPGRSARFCEKHKEAHHVDVINKRCQHPSCTKQPAFGNDETKVVRWCSIHKRPGDVNIIIKRCKKAGCYVKPHYGGPNGKPIWCKKHKVSP